jgi:NAD(P)-dependent dehydrogenase (short-subunit alcohol dehydrogenase family)
MSKRFLDRVAFVTGGATGLGRAFAQAIVAEGGSVVLADVDISAAEATAAAMCSGGATALAVPCDVADEDSVAEAVDRVIGQVGGIDVLVNNAARHLKKYNQGFSKLTHQEIRGLFDVNLLGIVNCSLACQTSMRERGGGAIVNMSSLAGYTAASAYGVTKLAVRGLTIAFAHDFAGDNIRVNAVAPTLTPTESVLAEFSDEHFEKSVAERQLIRRRATMDDVVNTMLYLCSEKASFITGETIRVTGGGGLSI